MFTIKHLSRLSALTIALSPIHSICHRLLRIDKTLSRYAIKIISIVFPLLIALNGNAESSNKYELVQWSDKVPDGFFTIDETTKKGILCIRTGEYDYSVGSKQNWRGCCYSQGGKNTVWQQLKINENGDLVSGTCSNIPEGTLYQTTWFEYQPLNNETSWLHGTIAKKSIIPENYNEKNEFEFDYKGKSAKILNSRNFKIISSLNVLENGDIQFTLFHTSTKVYTITNNGNGTFSYIDNFIPIDSRNYSDLSSTLYFYLPTENGTAVVEIGNKEKNTSTNKHFYVKETGSGDKDGSNWKNAMSFADFCTQIAVAQNGTTFHFAAGEYGRNGYTNNSLQINSSVSIIGGYPETNDDVDKVKSDPVNYHTTFKETGFTGYNNCYSFFILNGKNLEIQLHNVEFNDTYLRSGGTSTIKKLTIDSCNFINCIPLHDITFIENLEVKNTYISGGIYTKYLDTQPQIECYGTNALIENCTFKNDITKYKRSLHLNLNGYGSIKNCTFYDINQSSAIYLSSDAVRGKFENNTIIVRNVKNVLDFNNVDFIGNIFNGLEDKPVIENLSVNNNNLLSFKSKSSTNKFVSDFSTILEGETIDDVFVPTLAYNGGFTPTVKLIADKLADKTSIRFPLEETSVTVDQRGVKRLDNTCPGSYEMECVASSPTISVESVTPYSCQDGDVTDGSLTISVKNWSSKFTAYKDSKTCTPTKVNGTVASFTFNELGKNSKFTFSVEDDCGNKTEKEIDMQALSKENGLFLLTYITAGAGRDKNDDPNEPACSLDDHRIKMTVKGGSAPYTFEIYNSKNQRVSKEVVEPKSGATSYIYTSGLLAPDNYTVYVSDASGCRYGDSKHANFTAKSTLSLAAYKSECNGEKSIHLMVNGSNSGSVALYRDNNDKDPYVAALMPLGKEYADVPGVYEYGVATLKDGCFAYSPINYIPLSQSFMYKLYDISVTKPFTTVEPTCIGQKGSITIYPESELENTIYSGFTYVCNLADATSGEIIQAKEDIIDLNAPVTFEDVDPGKYTVYFSYLLGECAQGSGSKKSVEISGVDIPTPLPVTMSLFHDNWCDPADGGRDFSIKNWTENYYTARLYSTDLTEENTIDLPYKESESETLLRDNIEPTSISTNNSATFEIRGLKGGFYRFVVSDPCGQSWMNRVFKVEDNVKPTPRIETLATPYSCKTKDTEEGKDGVITVRVYDYYSSTAWIDDKVVLPDDSGSDYYDFIMKDLGPGDKRTFKLVDVCNKEQVLDLDMTELAKENGLFYIKNATLKTGSDCFADNRKIEYEARGGMPAYNFKVFNKGTGEEVYDYTAYPLTGSTNILLVGDYKLIATDKNGCIDEVNDGLEVTTIRTLKAAKTNLCDGYFHVDLNYDGTLVSAKVYEKKNGRTKKVYFDEGSDNKSFVMKGEYDGVIVSFSPDGCQGLALFDEAEEKPLSIAFSTKPVIEDQTCPEQNKGKYTCFPASKIDLRGYKMYLVVTNKTTGEVRMDSVTQSGLRMSVDKLPAGNYEAFIALGYNGCVVDASKKVLDDFSIKSVEKPTLAMDNSTSTIRCEGEKKSVLVNVTNYNKELYTWQLTKDEEDISSSAKVSAPSGSEGSFVLGNLTAGSYVFSLVDQCNELYSKKFKITENIKKPLEFSTHHQGISCEGMADGVINFSVSNWTVNEDKYVLTNTQTKETIECPYPFYKGGTITFTLTGIGSGTYSFVATDLCGTEYPAQIADFEELNKSSKFGLTLDEAASDAECNEDSRKISATVSGLENQSPYTYVLYKVDGEKDEVIDDKQKEVTDRTYTSEKLDYGKYKLVAVNNNGCEAAVTRTFTASHILTGTRLVCGENTHVELSYDGIIEGVSVKTGDKWSDIDFAEGAEKSSFDCKGVVTDVRVKETGCYTVAALSDYEITGDLFDGVSATTKVEHQTCYGEDNGSIGVTYTGFSGKMNVAAYATDAKGTVTPSVYDDEQKCLVIPNLAPGSYKVVLGLSVNGCSVSNQSFPVADNLEIKALEEPKFLEDNYQVVHNQCEGGNKGRMHLEMTGWKDGIYKWSIKRATDTGEPKENTHCGEKLANGATAFDLWTLPEGETIFTMWDACKTVYSKIETIKAEYADPLTIDMGENKAYTCADRTDGSLTFVASSWDVENKAAFKKNGEEMTEKVSPVIKEDKAYFQLKNQGSGVYTLTTTDLCDRTAEKMFDFTAFSEENGLNIATDFDAEGAICDLEKRVFKINVSGGTAPYIYNISKTDGTVIETSEATEKATYESKSLSDGLYKVTVTDKTECIAEFDEVITVSAPAELKVTPVVAGALCDEVGGSITLEVDGGTAPYTYQWSDAEGNIMAEISNKAEGLQPEQKYTAKVTDANGCSVENKDIEMTWETVTDLEITSVTTSVVGQTCYGVNNGQIKANVKANANTANMKMVAENVATGARKEGYADAVGNFLVDSLAPGNYNVYLDYNAGDCPTSNSAVKIDDVLTVTAVEAHFAIDKEYVVAEHPTCFNKPNGKVGFRVLNWNENYTVTISRDGIVYGNNNNVTVSGNAADVTATGQLGGLHRMVVSDACGNKDSIETTLAPISAPSITEISADSVLLCNYSTTGFVELNFSSTYPQNMIVSVSGSVESIKMTADSTIKFENLTIGHYDINFKHTDDACTDATVYSVNVKPENEFTMALDLVGDACTEQKINATVGGGAKPYASAVWTKVENNKEIAGAPIETLEGVGVGSFFLTVVDANGCEYISDTIQANLIQMAEDLGEISMTVDGKDNTCYGLNDGQLIVNIDGNTYNSELNISVVGADFKTDSVVDIAAGAIVFNELPASDYKVTLSYAGAVACESGAGSITVTKTLSQPTELKVEPIVISALCEEAGGGIQVNASGGVKPYSYVWSGADGIMDITDFRADGLPLGNYTCKVTDASNCVTETGEMKIQLAAIASLEKVKVNAKAIGQKCYGVPNGSIEAEVDASDMQFLFKLTAYNEADNIKKTSVMDEDGKVVINALEPGDYKLTLDYNFKECPVTESAIVVAEKLNVAKISAPLAIDKDYIESVDPTCYNEPNGKTSIKVSNWSEFYTASAFQNGIELPAPDKTEEEGSAFFTSTGLGSHVEMAIADVCGNSDTMKYDLNPLAKPEVSLVDSYTSLKCSYSTDGYLKYNIIGGHPATYKVELAAMHGEAKTFDYAETVLADNLGQDYYTFSYKSTLAGCSDHASHEVIVTVPQPIELSVAVSPLVCNEEASGEFSFLPYRGGTLGKVKYDSIQYTKNYAVEIFNKDDATIQQAFSEIQSIRISAKNQDDETLKNTLIQAIIPDEEKPDSLAPKDFPLQKFWKDDAGYMVPKAWIGFDMLPADVYYITTVDNQNCTFTDSIIIDRIPTYNTLVFNSVVFDAEAAACQSDKRRIEINVSGGWGEYAYSIADLKDVNADENQENVDAGGVAMVDESAAGDSTYEENGVGYYRSAILEPGTYQITVTDAHGCMQTYDEDIVVKANLLLEGEVLMDKCDPTAANTIQTNVTTANGYKAAAPYSFKATYEDKKIENTSQDGTFKVDSVPNTVVGIWVTDANQCEGFKSFPVPRNDSIEVLTVKKEEVIDNKCFEDLSGAVVFKLFGGNPAYTHFILDDDTLSHDDDIMLAVVNKEVTDKRIKLSDIDLKKSDMSNLFCMTNMAAGDHRLTITDSAGCAASIEFSLTQPEMLQLVAGATGVCPGKRAGEAMGRIYPLAVSGGVKPYQYALDYTDTSGDIFSTNDHIDAREGEKHTLFVQDANGCMVNSEPVSVEGTFDAGSLDQRCLLSTWHGLGDVLVVTDVTNYGTLKEGVSLDSTVITFSNLPEGVTCQQMENELYLYGIPDSVSSILWYGDALYGPLWGVPSDIAAGVKSQEEYEKTKKDIDAEKKTAQTMYDAVIAKLNNKSGLSASKIIELQTDSATYADMLASIHQRERTNCTIDMVKKAFIPLVDETTAKRMTFWEMSSITKLDVTSFTYDFSMTSYLNGCTMSVDYNGLGVDLEDPNKYYVRFDQKDILDLRCAPNPVAYGEAATVYVTLGNKVGYTYRVYDFQGQIIKEATDVPADQLEQVTEEETSQVTYQSAFELQGVTSPCIVTVSTGADMSSVIVLVKGGAK